jgi:anaerobic ribonucleoside-triphosphate reductase activating protein
MSRLEPMLNLAALQKDTLVVGPGVRDAVWVQGCSIRCPGCANLAYWSHEPRVSMSVTRLLGHFSARRGRIDGISVLGGEPTEQADAVAHVLAGIQKLGMSTVLFSGRTLEELREDPSCTALLAHTDLLIDGPYIQEQQDLTLHWRGSRNQRLIRLSERFSDSDMIPRSPNGELFVSGRMVTAHGIGTMALKVQHAQAQPAANDTPEVAL